jgi:hypothetical protein
MPDVRVAADGTDRVAIRRPPNLDTSDPLTWAAFHFPDGQLHAELLSDDEVTDWVPMQPKATDTSTGDGA